MSTYKEVKEIKTLWRGKPQTVKVHPAMKEIEIGWHPIKEEPLKVLEFDPNKDGLQLFVLGAEVATLILVEGSITIKDVRHIQKYKSAIQIFSEK